MIKTSINDQEMRIKISKMFKIIDPSNIFFPF
jgi:hypothetical protein